MAFTDELKKIQQEQLERDSLEAKVAFNKTTLIEIILKTCKEDARNKKHYSTFDFTFDSRDKYPLQLSKILSDYLMEELKQEKYGFYDVEIKKSKESTNREYLAPYIYHIHVTVTWSSDGLVEHAKAKRKATMDSYGGLIFPLIGIVLMGWMVLSIIN